MKNKLQSDHLLMHLNTLVCPICGKKLTYKSNTLKCSKNHTFDIKDDIPAMFVEEETDASITKQVKKFYEKNPFPNYDEIDNNGTLAQKADQSVFAGLLQEQIYYQAKVLEVGCGTGQLSNFLATANRQIFGVDMSLAALKLGQKFKEKNNLTNVGFYQMNIFKPIFKPETFDYILCNGVLHHTKNPKEGFEILVNLLKKDGYILIGLYNKYGRLITDIRRSLFATFGENLAILDPNIRQNNMGAKQKLAWYLDQYTHPNESKHTIAEVLGWFEQNNIDFVSCIPKLDFTEKFTKKTHLFENVEKPTKLNCAINQALQIVKGSREGGLFVMIGRKK